MNEIIVEIEKILRSELWWDFNLFSFNRNELTLVASQDLLYYHNLELIFKDVFFISGNINFQIDITRDEPIIRILDGEKEKSVNLLRRIEGGHYLFQLCGEESDFIIAAKSLSYNRNIVYYYDRPDLGPNERVFLK